MLLETFNLIFVSIIAKLRSFVSNSRTSCRLTAGNRYRLFYCTRSLPSSRSCLTLLENIHEEKTTAEKSSTAPENSRAGLRVSLEASERIFRCCRALLVSNRGVVGNAYYPSPVSHTSTFPSFLQQPFSLGEPNGCACYC